MSKILLGKDVYMDLDKLIETRLLVQANSADVKKYTKVFEKIAALAGATMPEVMIEKEFTFEVKPSKVEFTKDSFKVPAPSYRVDSFDGPPREPISVDGDKPLSKGARSVLTYLHQSYPHWKSKTQMWVATGYAPGGGFNNLVYELTGAGLIEKDGTGKYASLERHTPDQLDDSFDPSLSKWDAKLSLGARKVFHVLMSSTSETFSKDQLAEITGYTTGGGFNNLVYELTGKELIKKVGTGYQVNPEVLEL